MDNSDNACDAEGVVYKKSNGFYTVRPETDPARMVLCEISSRLRKELVYDRTSPGAARHRVNQVRELDHADPLAVGDVVRYRETTPGKGLILAVGPRRNTLRRHTNASRPGAHAFEQVLVANLDQVVPVFAVVEPAPHWNLLDRYLAAAESGDLPALICITKLDLAAPGGELEGELQAVAAEYRRIGYPVQMVSAVTGQGLDALRAQLAGKVSALVGKSGVGKTSLLNALEPGLGLRVAQVSRTTGKGKHTTTALEMVALAGGGAIVDTPGMREYGLWDVDPDELATLFPEMRPLLGRCRFGLDCRHDEEPGCLVRRAVMDGQISPRRYHSYLRLREEGGQP